jgi:hypothetical protein
MTESWIAYIGPIVTLLGFVLGVWWKVEGKITAASEKAEKASADLAEHKLHVAETYVTKAGMQEQTGQIMRAIEGVGNRIDGLHERLDRAFERSAERTTR